MIIQKNNKTLKKKTFASTHMREEAVGGVVQGFHVFIRTSLATISCKT
jgi:hypothetical protein